MFKIVWKNSVGDVFKERIYSYDEYSETEALNDFIQRDNGCGLEIFAVGNTINFIEIN